MAITPINKEVLERDLNFLRDHKVRYGLGAKAPEKPFFRDPKADLSSIKAIDCSGIVRLFLYRATGGKLVIPDGSWNQRQWFEDYANNHAKEMHEIRDYSLINRYMTEKRLFICFIKPWTNGCGKVGHVWLTSEIDGDRVADTLESHGGKNGGPDSRDWNASVLRKQFYSGFELPVELVK